jgi:glycosyltransferase involved in cell wall biosynthesis
MDMSKSMRIAQVSPLYESVPPRFYGGTERVVSILTEELVRRGHDVTLFSSGDSLTSARLCSPCPNALRLDRDGEQSKADHAKMFSMVQERESQFDIIHFHTETMHLEALSSLTIPTISTLHGRLDIEEKQTLLTKFPTAPLTSISFNQRSFLVHPFWCATVYHGLPRSLFQFQAKSDNYLAFLGRISAEKRFDRAVEIARATGYRLKVAAKIDYENDGAYIAQNMNLFAEPFVEFVGEIGDAEKPEFLGNAKALVFPIDWPEPFGLVMIEALACGTPVVAFNSGSVPEIINHGVTGFIVNNVSEATLAVEQINSIDRQRCREEFERRFTSERMVSQYEDIYQQICTQFHGRNFGGMQ